MSLSFPSSPTLGQTYTSNSNTWTWNGVTWSLVQNTSLTLSSLAATSITGSLTGNVVGNTQGTHTGNVVGNVTGNLTGNALTATKLATPVLINGASFDGSSSITITPTLSGSSLTGTTLAGNITTSSLTSVGIITSGIWNGTPIANANLANSTIVVNGTTLTLGDTNDTLTVPATSVTGTTLNSTVVNSSLTSFGTSPTLNSPIVNTAINTSSSSLNIFNTTASVVNAFGSANVISIGSTSGSLTVNNPTLSANAVSATSVTSAIGGINVFGATSQYVQILGSGLSTPITINYASGDVAYLPLPAASFYVYLNNVPTTASRAFTLTIIVQQGATPYIPLGLYINSVAYAIVWAGGVTPTGRATKSDLVSLTIYTVAGAYLVLGALSSFG
jgi:hypothetical protein